MNRMRFVPGMIVERVRGGGPRAGELGTEGFEFHAAHGNHT
ncbi:MAG: hypothetical protein WEB29_06430 [Chloroflexota bacterium]